MDFARCPGGDLVAKGLDDLARSTVTAPLADPEHRLYEWLAGEDSDSAHSRYNALLRRLTAFESALEHLR